MKSLGKFGDYGGVFVAELLMPALEQLESAYLEAKEDPGFWRELEALLSHFAGRPTPLYHAKNASRDLGFKLYLKREDLLHGGAHNVRRAAAPAAARADVDHTFRARSVERHATR